MNTVLTKKKEDLIQYFKEVCEDVGKTTSFSIRFFKEVIRPPYEMKEFIKQCYSIGYKSLPLVTITGFIMGLVLTLQSRPTLAKFGAESWLPSMVAIHSEVGLYRYLAEVLESLKFVDIFPATIKTFFFGFFIGMIGCYKGFNAANGTESVGKAANSAVVTASLSIFIIDMIAVQLTDLFL